MANKTIRLASIDDALLAIDNGDGTYSLAVSSATGALTTLLSQALPSCVESTQLFADAPANTKEVWLTIRTAGLTLRTDGGEATAGANGSDFAADASTPYVFSDDRTDLLTYRAIQNGGTATGWIVYRG